MASSITVITEPGLYKLIIRSDKQETLADHGREAMPLPRRPPMLARGVGWAGGSKIDDSSDLGIPVADTAELSDMS